MCVEIIKSENKVSFKPELPLQEQICDSHEVLIDCDLDCPKVIKFLDEVEKYCKNGQNLPIHIKIADNSNLLLYSQTKKINKELLINDIIHHMVSIQEKTDKKLEEITSLCLKAQNE